MKFNIILSSSGFNDVNNEISNEIIEIFKEVSKGKKVLILVNAASPKGTPMNIKICKQLQVSF